jgi:hypothetical protein
MIGLFLNVYIAATSVLFFACSCLEFWVCLDREYPSLFFCELMRDEERGF